MIGGSFGEVRRWGDFLRTACRAVQRPRPPPPAMSDSPERRGPDRQPRSCAMPTPGRGARMDRGSPAWACRRCAFTDCMPTREAFAVSGHRLPAWALHTQACRLRRHGSISTRASPPALRLTDATVARSSPRAAAVSCGLCRARRVPRIVVTPRRSASCGPTT